MAGAIGVVATRAHATEIHPEAMLTFRTIDPVTISTDQSGGAFQPMRSRLPVLSGSRSSHGKVQVAPPAPYYGGYYGAYPYPYYDPYFYNPYFYGPSIGFYYGGGYGFGGG